MSDEHSDADDRPQTTTAVGSVMASFGLRLRGQLRSEGERAWYARTETTSKELRQAKRVRRRERRKDFWRDVYVQFLGSIAAAYLVILLAILTGYLKNPQIVACIAITGVALCSFFFLILAWGCFTQIFGQVRDAQYGYVNEYIKSERLQLQILAFRVIAFAILTLVILTVGFFVTSALIRVLDPLWSSAFPAHHG